MGIHLWRRHCESDPRTNPSPIDTTPVGIHGGPEKRHHSSRQLCPPPRPRSTATHLPRGTGTSSDAVLLVDGVPHPRHHRSGYHRQRFRVIGTHCTKSEPAATRHRTPETAGGNDPHPREHASGRIVLRHRERPGHRSGRGRAKPV